MAGGPIWYELMTPDPTSIAPFYRATLGWEIPREGMAMPNGSDYRMIARADGGNAGGVLTLTAAMSEAGAKPAWFTYFHVPDVDAAVEQAEGLGAKVWMAAQSLPAGRIAMLADPQGAPFYVMDPTPPPGMPDAKSDVFDAKKAGHCRWQELATTDAPAANEFYNALFDWNTETTMPMGPAGDYRFIEFDGMPIGALNPMIREGQPPMWLLYFGVSDIDAAHQAAIGNGGRIVHDTHQVPGGEFIFVAADPAGAMVAFVGPKGE